MNKYIALSLVVLLFASCCPGKRMTSDGSTTDSVRREHREIHVDSVSRRATVERRVESLTDAEIVTEVVTYDTSRTDSLGQSPVKERRRTVARIRNTATETDTTTVQIDSTAVHTEESTADSTSHQENHTTEVREAYGLPPLLLPLVFVLLVVVVVWRVNR